MSLDARETTGGCVQTERQGVSYRKNGEKRLNLAENEDATMDKGKTRKDLSDSRLPTHARGYQSIHNIWHHSADTKEYIGTGVHQ